MNTKMLILIVCLFGAALSDSVDFLKGTDMSFTMTIEEANDGANQHVLFEGDFLLQLGFEETHTFYFFTTDETHEIQAGSEAWVFQWNCVVGAGCINNWWVGARFLSGVAVYDEEDTLFMHIDNDLHNLSFYTIAAGPGTQPNTFIDWDVETFGESHLPILGDGNTDYLVGYICIHVPEAKHHLVLEGVQKIDLETCGKIQFSLDVISP